MPRRAGLATHVRYEPIAFEESAMTLRPALAVADARELAARRGCQARVVLRYIDGTTAHVAATSR